MKESLPQCFKGLKNFEADRLLPRESAAFVAERGSGQVSIDGDNVTRMAEWMLSKCRNNGMMAIDFAAQEMHPKTTDQSAVDWIFLMDTINFSFWTEDDSKFRVTYKGKSYTGYFGAAACVNRAIASGIPMTDSKWMKGVTKEQIEQIFYSDTGDLMPLCDLRAKAIAEAGKVLIEKFDGSFYNCLKKCDKSAMKLLATVVENFESYRDYASYKGQKISFLKRAQILVGDIYNCLKGKNDLADFSDIGSITMFADYRVPQVLAFFSVLKYSADLVQHLKARTLMEPGCETEVELRAFSIKAVDDIVEKVEELRNESDSNLPKITAVDVDNLLWYHRREKAKDVEHQIEYHRVRTIYY